MKVVLYRLFFLRRRSPLDRGPIIKRKYAVIALPIARFSAAARALRALYLLFLSSPSAPSFCPPPAPPQSVVLLVDGEDVLLLVGDAVHRMPSRGDRV